MGQNYKGVLMNMKKCGINLNILLSQKIIIQMIMTINISKLKSTPKTLPLEKLL